MSRKIDTSRELSDEDREYLRSRGREQLVEQLDYEARVNAAAEARKSQDHMSRVNDASPDVMSREPEDEVEEVDLPYHKWKKDELVEEATARGIDASGTVKELAERLEQDDNTSDEHNG